MPDYKKPLLIILSLSSLSACDALDENTGRVGNGVHTWYDNTRYRLSTYIYDQNRRQPELPPPAAPRYCYQVQTDIMCYTEPQEKGQGRFVGGQDAQGYIESVSFQDSPSYAVMSNAASTTYDSSSASGNTGLGGAYSGPPGVAPPLDTVQVGDTPAVREENGSQPFHYARSPSAAGSAPLQAKPSLAEPAKAAPASIGGTTASIPVQSTIAVPPSIMEDTSVSGMNGATPVALMSN